MANDSCFCVDDSYDKMDSVKFSYYYNHELMNGSADLLHCINNKKHTKSVDLHSAYSEKV